eukprot:gene16363-biopygen20272
MNLSASPPASSPSPESDEPSKAILQLLSKARMASHDISGMPSFDADDSSPEAQDDESDFVSSDANKYHAFLEAAQGVLGSRQSFRISGAKATAIQDNADGVVLSLGPTNGACVDLASKMQALYAFFVFPLNNPRVQRPSTPFGFSTGLGPGPEELPCAGASGEVACALRKVAAKINADGL